MKIAWRNGSQTGPREALDLVPRRYPEWQQKKDWRQQQPRAPQTVGQLGGHGRFLGWFEAGVPLFEFGAEGSVEGSGSRLQHEVSALF